jgi:hypothetical protein
MESGATIPFRRIVPPPLPNGRQPDTPPVPSAHLLYVRETLVRIAHLVGAVGEWEDDYVEESEDSGSVDLVQSISDGSKSLSGDDEDVPRTPSSEHKDCQINCRQLPCVFSPAWVPHSHVPSSLRTQLSPTALALDLAVSVDIEQPGYHCSLLACRGSMSGPVGRGKRPGTCT